MKLIDCQLNEISSPEIWFVVSEEELNTMRNTCVIFVLRVN